MTAADRKGPACRNGGKSMSKMPFLLVLRMKVWRRRILCVVISLSRA
jgi:hypothetical protein